MSAMCNTRTYANLLAIPGTGKRGRGRWLRRPRHIAVLRGLEQTSGTLRGSKLPPDDWADIPRKTERSWKAHRHQRWRPRQAPTLSA